MRKGEPLQGISRVEGKSMVSKSETGRASCVKDCQPEVGLSLAGMANYIKNQSSGYPGQWPKWDALESELDAYLDEFPVAGRVRLGLELTGDAPIPLDAIKIRARVFECLMALNHEQGAPGEIR